MIAIADIALKPADIALKPRAPGAAEDLSLVITVVPLRTSFLALINYKTVIRPVLPNYSTGRREQPNYTAARATLQARSNRAEDGRGQIQVFNSRLVPQG